MPVVGTSVIGLAIAIGLTPRCRLDHTGGNFAAASEPSTADAGVYRLPANAPAAPPDRHPIACAGGLTTPKPVPAVVLARRRSGIKGRTREMFASSRFPVSQSAILASQRPSCNFILRRLCILESYVMNSRQIHNWLPLPCYTYR
jgi:hypothetical protein